MALELPAQLYATTLYDRHQKQSLSFVFLPASSLHNGYVPPLDQLWYQLEPTATYRREITASYLPAALASLLSSDSTNPFAWVDQAPTNVVPAGAPIWIHPNSLGFAEYVAYSEAVPFAESPLHSKSLMAAAVSAGVHIGVVAGMGTPWILVTVPAGIILCTAAVLIGPAIADKFAQLMGV